MSCGNNDDETFSYRLITNAQWQTLARNIESWAANWTDAGVLKQGYNGGTCANDDDDACYTGSGLPTDRVSDTNPKAMYVLRSGGQVWDVSGNIWDIVDLDGLGGGVTYTNPSGEGWYELDSVESIGIYSGSAEVSAADFLPRDTYPNLLSETGIGMIYYWKGANADMIILRGGNHWENERVGPFMASITQNYLGPTGMVGFRCSCSPAIR